MLKNTISNLRFPVNAQKQLVLAINLSLITWFCFEVATLSWRLMPSAGIDTSENTFFSTTQHAQSTPSGKAHTPIWDIVKWHLFGQKNVIRQGAVIPVRLPETRLNLALRGLLASATPGAGGAIIAAGNGQENYYAAGAILPGGATLKSIHNDHVIIQRGQSLETLKLPKDRILATAAQAHATGYPANYQGGGRQMRRGISPTGTPSLGRLRNRLISRPQEISDFVNISPHTERGRFMGYKIQAGRNQAMFTNAGLKNGDVVLEINGIRLDRPDKAMSALRGLSSARQANLTILRNRQRKSIMLDFTQ